MRRLLVIAFVSICVLACTGCSENNVATPENNSASVDPEGLAAELTNLASWPVLEETDALTFGKVKFMEREQVYGDVYHYSFQVQVGAGPYDVIGVHRVVLEKRPYKPVKTNKAVFLLHGDASTFEGLFLPGSNSPYLPDNHSIAVYLAENGVDVWGIDQTWTLVPEEVTDYSFMENWDIQHDADMLDIGLSIARFSRLLTGSGFGKFHLLGYSSGAMTGYAFVNQETQKPPACRHVMGFIPADFGIHMDVPEIIDVFCMYHDLFYKPMVESGIYGEMQIFLPVGTLALMDPDGDSPIVPGFTNKDVALVLGAATHMFSPMTPWYHFHAGEFDEVTGMPIGFQFITYDQWVHFMAGAPPYESAVFIWDYCRTICECEDVPYDDYLSEVTIPVLYLGAAGGVGDAGIYATSLLGSTDITINIVQLLPLEDRMFDFGHIDLWTADNAPELVWVPMLEWVEAHSGSCVKKDLAFEEME